MKKRAQIYTQLSDLPSFIKEKKISVSEQRVPEFPGNPADDESLLSEAMKDVRAINKQNIHRASKPTVVGRHRNSNDGIREILKKTVEDDASLNVTNLPEYMEGFVEGINPITMEKLRNGDFAVQKTLDLHGRSIEDAQAIFELFIREATHAGLNCVKIIHGRGLKSKGEPVLKGSLKAWIIRAMHRKWVTAFSSATMPDGGPGATYILLRKRPVKKRIHIIG